MTTSYTSRIFCRLALALAVATCLSLAAAGTARANEYTVEVTTTSMPGWWSPWIGTSRYRAGDMFIDTDVGSYVIGAYRRWRLETPNNDLLISGGSIGGRLYTPNDAFVSQVRQGSDGGAVRTLMASKDTTTFTRSLTSGDWLEFGLYAESSTKTSDAGGNRILITSLSVRMYDRVAPDIGNLRVPDPYAWHGAGCSVVAWHESDRGSGIGASRLRNDSTGTVIAAWNEPTRAGLAPGNPAADRSACVPGSGQAHGLNALSMLVTDRSGRQRSHSFSVRYDLRVPEVTSLPSDGATFAEPTPSLTFEAADTDSGLQTVQVYVDGQLRTASTDGQQWSFTTQHLSVGSHEIAVRATDRVGNSQELRRTINVVDTTAPDIVVASPGAEGGMTPVIDAQARDEGSAVAPGSWTVAVDGTTVPVAVEGNRLVHSLAPLAVGEHQLQLSVADVEGNRRTVTLTYRALDDGRGAALAGGGSGVFVASAPAGPLRYGSRARIVATAAAGGRPLAAHRLVVTGPDGRTLASELADVTGTADLVFPARHPGRLSIHVQGRSLSAASVRLLVAPRLVLRKTVRHTRVGKRVRLHGIVLPRNAVNRVSLEARVGGSWYPLRRSVRVRNGRFRTTVTSASPGRIAIRVRSRGRSGWSSATSNLRVLVVRPDWQRRSGRR